MTKHYIRISALILAMMSMTMRAYAFDLKDLFNKDTLTDMLEGVLSKTDLEVQDLAGEWTTTGSAVTFQTEDLLSKAGGTATASAIEQQINPYFQKYGLTGAVFTIEESGNFTLKVKNKTITGQFTKEEDNTFTMSLNLLGSNNICNVKTYIQKTSSSMDIMFDASKLQTLVTSIASVTNIATLKTISSMLNSYEGICIGFTLDKTGNVSTESSSSGSDLMDLFNGGKSSDKNNNQSDTTQKSTKSILDLFKR